MNSDEINSSTTFPAVFWNKQRLTFVPLGSPLPEVFTLKFALVHPLRNGGLILAEIVGRGWCIPGGHIEEGETAEACARREAWEEAGLTLGELELIGHTLIYDSESNAPNVAAHFIAKVNRCDPLPENSESTGVRFTTFDELSSVYYQWDPLLDAIFDFVRTKQSLPSFDLQI